MGERDTEAQKDQVSYLMSHGQGLYTRASFILLTQLKHPVCLNNQYNLAHCRHPKNHYTFSISSHWLRNKWNVEENTVMVCLALYA